MERCRIGRDNWKCSGNISEETAKKASWPTTTTSAESAAFRSRRLVFGQFRRKQQERGIIFRKRETGRLTLSITLLILVYFSMEVLFKYFVMDVFILQTVILWLPQRNQVIYVVQSFSHFSPSIITIVRWLIHETDEHLVFILHVLLILPGISNLFDIIIFWIKFKNNSRLCPKELRYISYSKTHRTCRKF